MIAALLALFAGPPVEALLLDGRRIRGELVETTLSAVVLQDGVRRSTLPREDLLRLDVAPETSTKSPIHVHLLDGSRFGAQSFESDGRVAKTAGAAGDLTFPVEHLAAVLLVDDPQEEADFSARTKHRLKSDRVAIARDGKRLVLEGIIGRVGAEKIEFTLDGDLLPINRSRGRALYFAQRSLSARPAAMIADRRGDLWAAAEWSWTNGVRLRSPAGFDRVVLSGDLASIDLSAGRVVYLSDMEPTVMQHVPGFDKPWLLRRDHGPSGGAIELAGHTFVKGLVLHSRTTVEYNLAGEYRRFQTVVGVPLGAGTLGDAEVRVIADDKPLWRQRVRAGEQPQELDLPTAGVKTLRLDVDFGRNLDLGDHVAFADAKVVK